ncbi:unnamed protein product [Rhizoctonia solani]|uniref:Uncharacterized protein n=2 Tax=Rhizoctonia solani TaxID=456999 RepID=A0A8H3AFT0_9AGAM|nr:unnamed protein product [Rhizoctonia solani]
MAGPPRRSGSSPSAGLVPAIASSLRNVMMYNHTTLTQAISQIEAIGDIQNELVNARSAHAQLSNDLQMTIERSNTQSLLLKQTQDELRAANQKLHGAREQLRLVESRLVAADARSSSGQAPQSSKVQALESALSSANQQINELTRRLQMATSAAIASQHSDSPITETEVLNRSSARVQALERRLAVIFGLSDQDLAALTSQLVETLTGPNTNAVSGEIFAYFKAMRGEFDAVCNATRTSTARNAMLEATLTTIRDLRIGTPLTAPRSIITEVRPTVGDNLTQASPVDGEIEMDVERTEAARVARQGSSVTPTAQPQPVGPQQQRPSSIQPSEIPQQVGTPTQPTSFAQQQDSPQRKRQRTLTSGSMEPLPRDHILHAHVSLVANTYRIEAARSASNSGDSATGQKQLVCKLCE